MAILGLERMTAVERPRAPSVTTTRWKQRLRRRSRQPSSGSPRLTTAVSISARGISQSGVLLDELGTPVTSTSSPPPNDGCCRCPRRWALEAKSRNQNTLLLLIAIGIGSLLFGFVVLRSFASPLTRLRLQAERISRGELNAEPIPVAGPSDVRKVTGAINDMASTLSLVEDHMDALALAELNELPKLDALPGHVGSTMKASMERVVALTARLQTSESRLAEEARIDNLTGLPNRFAVLEHLERTLSGLVVKEVSARCGTIGVMFLDVDGFKSVNDTHGHAVGDVVLRDIAQRLRGSIRDVDFIARLGGDEFLVVVARRRRPGATHGFRRADDPRDRAAVHDRRPAVRRVGERGRHHGRVRRRTARR